MIDDRTRRTLRALREDFDRGFAAPPRAPDAGKVALLALRAGGEPVAVRVLDTAGLLPARPIVPVPSRRPALLGVAGLRGAVVPVFSAARLLGHVEAGAPAWIVLAGDAERVGLAFDGFDGHLLAAPSDLREADARAHVAGAVRVGDAVRPVLAIASLLRTITGNRDGEHPR